MMYTTREAAQLLGLQRRTVAAYCRRGLLHPERHGDIYLLSPEEIARFQRERRKRGENATERKGRVYERRQPGDAAARFWAKVDKSGECWLWTAKSVGGRYGHGRFRRGRKSDGMVMAHRFSWELHNGPIPDSLFVCHKCDTPICVRPDHLFLGTAKDNSQDMSVKGRSKRGEHNHAHKLTAEDVRKMRRAYAADELSQRELAARFGLSQGTVGAILRRETWQWVI